MFFSIESILIIVERCVSFEHIFFVTVCFVVITIIIEKRKIFAGAYIVSNDVLYNYMLIL